MPVVGTPTKSPPPTIQPVCADQLTVRPKPTILFGCDIKARRKAVETTQGLTPTIAWTMVDQQGNPVDLTSCGAFDGNDGSEVQLVVRESIFRESGLQILPGTVTNAAKGEVSFDLTTAVTGNPGIYIAEATVRSSTGVDVFKNTFYIIVNRSVDPGGAVGGGQPPTLAEIRLHMRDSDPGENSLLDTVQFDDAEIAHAIEIPVIYWNESNPPISQKYNTSTYPYRFWWLEGVVARLYLMAAHWYRRNHLPYAAGGIQVDDLNKAAEYERIGQQKWEEYKLFVLHRKVSLNCEAAITTQGSIYGGYWWRGGWY